VIGARIQLRALSIDKLREEALRNAERKVSRYDIVAADLPWIGEFAERGVLLPLDSLMDIGRLDESDDARTPVLPSRPFRRSGARASAYDR
jgi:multiple sugar transport system substrate-binding protein